MVSMDYFPQNSGLNPSSAMNAWSLHVLPMLSEAPLGPQVSISQSEGDKHDIHIIIDNAVKIN